MVVPEQGSVFPGKVMVGVPAVIVVGHHVEDVDVIDDLFEVVGALSHLGVWAHCGGEEHVLAKGKRVKKFSTDPAKNIDL